MQEIDGILTSYGTGPMGRLGCDGVPKSSQSMNSRSEGQEKPFSEVSKRSMETRALLRAYERYKDPAAGCDQHFQFYKRVVPLSNIHAMPNSKKKLHEAAVDKLAQIVQRKGLFEFLGCITVCDDSIVSSNGPGTKIRSHLLVPTFSIVDGHLRINAMKLAKERGHPLPDTVVVEVAVPDADAFPVDTEKHLLQLAIRLNQTAGKKPFTKNRDHRDLRRIDFMRRFLNATPEFKSMNLSCLGNGLVQRAASKAIESHAIPGDNIGRIHLERYVRVALLFNSSPDAYEIYKREAQKCKEGANYISIVTLNSGMILKSGPILRVLIVECLCVHGNTQKAQIRRQGNTIFIRNIITLYEKLWKTAQQLGFREETFLSVDVSLQNRRMERQSSTLREAIVAIASSRVLCLSHGKMKKISTTLQESLKVGWRERQVQDSPTQGSTARLSLSSAERPFHKSGTSSGKYGRDGSQQLKGEETTSLCLAHAHQEKKRRSEDSSEDSPNLRSDEEETELQQKNSAFRETPVALKSTTRGQKRASSPERLSILRRKVLKRDGHHRHVEVSNGEVDSRASHLHVHGQNDDNKDGNKRNSISHSKENATTTPSPPFLSATHQAKLGLSRRDVERLRTELRDHSSVPHCAGLGMWNEVYKEEGPESVRRCAQFLSFWSNYRSAVDERGYTQFELPSSTLTAAIRNMLRSTNQACQKKHEESCDLDKTEGATFCGDTEKILHSANVDKQHQQIAKGGEYAIAPVKVGLASMMVETALTVISEWLGLNNALSSKLNQESFLSNAELLSTPEQRDARKPRLAFRLRRDGIDKEPWHPQRNPSYTFIVSGDTGFPMWVWERTHVLLQSPDELLPLIAKSIKPQRVFVKPRSVFLCRGDVVHAFENTYEIEGQGRSNPIAVTCHLIQCGMDRQKPEETEGWWTKYIATPGS